MIPLKQILAWDVTTWNRALQFWQKEGIALLPKNARGLEVGAWNGGITAFFAIQGCSMVCSDIEPLAETTRKFHHGLALNHLIEYQTFSATNIPYLDDRFDFVVFKSVLGAIGRNDQIAQQQQAIQEIHRVLKPGGILFFAENLRGSLLHQFARKNFVPWGNTWRYISRSEMEGFLSDFSKKKIHTTGFFAAFVPPPEWLKSLVALFDGVLFFIPKRWRYVVYGIAVK